MRSIERGSYSARVASMVGGCYSLLIDQDAEVTGRDHAEILMEAPDATRADNMPIASKIDI